MTGFPSNLAVGDTVPVLTLPPVDRTALALFAGASGDHNPIHIDTDFARRSGMPDVFAQGMLGMAWLGRLVTRIAPQDRLRRLSGRFLGITHLGHVIACRGRVAEQIEEDGEKRLRLEIETINQYGEVKIAGEAVIAVG